MLEITDSYQQLQEFFKFIDERDKEIWKQLLIKKCG